LGKIIAMLNMKGGVGTTTLAVNIASALAKLEDFRVLLIDLDPQYNATQYLVDIELHPEYVDGTEPTVLEIMMGGRTLFPSVLSGTKTLEKEHITIDMVARTLYKKEGGKGKLDLIPSTLHLINLEMVPRGTEHRLQNFVQKIRDAYDFIIIDCPPTFSVFLLSGVLASDYYLVPLKPDPLSTLGILLLERVINTYSEHYGKEIQPLGVVFIMIRNTREMDNVMEAMRDTSVGKRYIFRSGLTMSTYVAEASRNNKALFEYPPAYRYGEEIREITKEFLSLL
jgi:chromosome partitioning protein